MGPASPASFAQASGPGLKTPGDYFGMAARLRVLVTLAQEAAHPANDGLPRVLGVFAREAVLVSQVLPDFTESSRDGDELVDAVKGCRRQKGYPGKLREALFV